MSQQYHEEVQIKFDILNSLREKYQDDITDEGMIDGSTPIGSRLELMEATENYVKY